LHSIDYPLTPYIFGFQILAWIYLRRYLNLSLLWSEFHEFKTVGPYVLDWAGERFKCPLAHYISTTLLRSLQALNLFWLFLMLRMGIGLWNSRR
jgi:acyl-CoA-dependent ceramide synthase